ncbi:paired amphipathic helix protein SIN3 [Ceratobasidium sp. AG-Ba]|nr:paired amphipathic helix protein SIN3 [Ceratobasidium sp. AG-Ba]
MEAYTSDPTQMVTLNVNDALNYLELIRSTYSDQPQKYNEFLAVMNDFGQHSISAVQSAARVADLFSDKPELVEGFNAFLPPGYRIQFGQDGNMVVVTPNSV